MFSILKNRSLLVLAGAEVVSALGTWITTMALYAIVVFQGTGGVAHTSALFLAAMGPTLLLGPVAGWMADRFDRKRLMITSHLLSAAVVSVVVFIGTERLGLIYLLMVLQSIAGSLMAPARSAVMPVLVDRAHLTQANAFLQQLTGLIKIVAPMFAGFVLTLMTPRQAIVLDVISYLLAAAALTLLPALPARRAEARSEQGKPAVSGWAALRQTIAQVSRQAPLLKLLFPAMYLLALVLLAFDVTAAVFTRDVLHASADFMGLLVGLVGVGTGLSALALMLVKGERNLWLDLVIGFLLMTAIPLSLALADWWGAPGPGRMLVLVGCLLGGLGLGLANVQAQTLIQSLAPEGWLGRLGGLFQSVMIAGQLSGLLLTPLIVPEPVSFGLFFGIGTGAMLLYCGWLAVVAWRSGRGLGEQPVAEAHTAGD